MNIEPIQYKDLPFIKELQPADWDDICIPHKWYLDSSFCTPLKMVINRKIAGIGTAIRHEDTAWLAHIIVHPDYRNKGLGEAITRALLDTIDKRKYETIYLIATDLGYPVYLKTGFELEAEYVHLVNKNAPFHSPVSPLILPFEDKYADEIYALDKLISAEGREEILRDHLRKSLVFVTEKKVEGVYFSSLANGLIIADNPVAGIELMKMRLQSKDFAILPGENKPAVEFLAANDFNQVRISRRMISGKKRSWRPGCIYNRVSGQIG
jgi:GNAT superfamily N-acetyltransferase